MANLVHQPRFSRAERRSGFTLMEMMLTVGLLAVIAAISWPVFSRSFSNHRLQKAGDVLRTAWSNTRLQAMSTGVTHVIEFDYGAGQFIIKPTEIDSADATEGTVIPQREGCLPEGIRFHSGEKLLDSRSDSAAMGAGGEGATTPQIFFFPDGSSSTAEMILTNDDQRFIKVELRGLTGVVKVGPVTAGDAPAGTEAGL